MLSFLFTGLFTVIMLTALFSATAGLAFIFRKSALKGRESGMYYIWIAVIILALIPIKIGEPQFILFSQNQVNAADTSNKADTPKLSDLLKTSSIIAVGADSISVREQKNSTPDNSRAEMDSAPTDKINFQIILTFISENKEILISVLMILWFAGFIFVTSRILYNYFKMKKLFYTESYICANERINGIFKECLETVGVKNKRVALRVMKSNFSSPCVCGLFNPIVFVDESCVNLNDKKLKYIFIHELCHVKRYDILYKVLSIIAAGVHWFNPLAYKVVKTIGEDCELSVDRKVMNIFGNNQGQSDYYMNVILDVAEQKCAVKNNRQTMKIPSASLFFGEQKNIKFLKRRYNNMKNNTNKKRLIIALSIFTAAIIAINIIIMSSCGIIGTPAVAAENSYPDANVYEAALKMCFYLTPDDEITQEQLAKITDIKIIGGVKSNGLTAASINDTPLGDLTPVSFLFDGWQSDLIPQVLNTKAYKDYIEKKFAETYATDESGRSRELDKLNAYYALKDPNSPDITPRDREEMYITYPITKEFPIYAFDPNASDREYIQMLGYFAKAGLLDDCFVSKGAIDVSYLTKLPNLKSVTLINISAENLDVLPDTVTVTREKNLNVYVDDNGNFAIR